MEGVFIENDVAGNVNLLCGGIKTAETFMLGGITEKDAREERGASLCGACGCRKG